MALFKDRSAVKGRSAPFIVIGHRGAAGLEPENTLRSFKRAIELGVDAIELDVYALEGRLVVIHDDRLDRTTNGRGPINALPLAELRKLDAGAGERIPLLEEVFAMLPANVGVNIELKGRGTAEPVAALLAAHPEVDALVSSFRHAELATFAALAPSVPVGALFQRSSPEMMPTAKGLGAWSVNLSNELATAARVRAVVDAGFHCLVYTINDPSRAKELERIGVAGIFTDRPDLVRRPRSRDDDPDQPKRGRQQQ